MTKRTLRRIVGAALVTLIIVAADVAFLPFLPRLFSAPFFQRSWEDITNGIGMQNNLLLQSPRSYPYPRLPDELVVGVFGGSVAKSFAIEMEQVLPTIAAARALGEQRRKRVRVENLAINGSSEPSQFNLLHLLADQIDVAVFLDGFNELFSDEPGCDELEKLWAENPRPAREIFAPVLDSSERLKAHAASWWWPIASHSSLFRLALFREAARLNELSGDFFRTLGKVSRIPGNGPKPTPPTVQDITRRVERWSRCVDLAARYAAAHQLPAFFFLQPSQYVPGAKTLTDEEREGCIYRQDEIPLLWSVYSSLGAIYALFDQHIAELRATGVRVHSLAGVFHDSTATIYTDKCCHVNKRGNQILAEAIFRTIAE
jgi:hypothetical protein